MGGVAVADSDALYLFGGQRGDEILVESYRFDLARQAWESLPPLDGPRVFATGGLIGGQPHVVGGSDGQEALASCERFDPVARSWSTCPEMQVPRESAGSAVVLNKLYVVGGAAAGEAIFGEIYDPDRGWQEMETPAVLAESPGWSRPGVTNVETRIYALGGRRLGMRSDEMFIYAPLVYQFFIPAASAGSSSD
jgi:hypothetical protein